MNLDQIETKCFILALFIRDDNERFLLGSRAYEFKDSQLHFVGNMYQNDVVEVQGNDGVMLAGQVRRGTSQPFDGYIGDQTVDRATIEQYRRDFMKFFRKNHYYKVVYVLPDGSAVQRRNGFIVEAPEVKELYQLFPEYHIGMNFEDINYYTYEEDAEGQEIYGESATLKIATSATGGLIWENGVNTTISGEGSNFTLDGTIDGGEISDLQLKGDTTQQTYTGKNLFNAPSTPSTAWQCTYTKNNDNSITITTTGTPTSAYVMIEFNLEANTQYTLSFNSDPVVIRTRIEGTYNNPSISSGTYNFTAGSSGTVDILFYTVNPDTSFSVSSITINELQLEKGSATTYEPYVGGIPAPNPDYPQEVQVVTGEQTVTITDGAEESQEYEVDFRGKNLFDKDLLPASWSSGAVTMITLQVKPNTQYTMSSNIPMVQYANLFLYDSSGSGSTATNGVAIGKNVTVTTKSDGIIKVGYRGTYTRDDYWYQIELGSTATTYAPYFTPIELCKIGTYQDYIYKSGDDWYVHKEIGKILFDGTMDFTLLADGPNGIKRFSYIDTSIANVNLSSLGVMCNEYRGITFNSGGGSSNAIPNTMALWNSGNTLIINTSSTTYSMSDFKTFLSTHPALTYYALATATDTQIADSTLIAQLEALLGATTYDGQTVFTVSSANRLAILDVTVIARTGGGIVWDNYGAEWEEGTGGGPTMVNVDSIDNVYPVLTLTGPAVNPQISVLTTNTTLSYSGTVTSSQELKIDMFNKTATLNGASVVGNVSGDWVYLKPGVNRITYTTNNADAPDSTIWWQEIVG